MVSRNFTSEQSSGDFYSFRTKSFIFIFKVQIDIVLHIEWSD